LKIVNILALAKEVVREPSKIVEFLPTAGFRPFKHFFVKESVKHPAKANLHMIRWIIEKFTEENDVILDPMAGTYSTCIMASMLRRNSIGVEYELKFYNMGLANIKQLQEQSSLEARGKIVVLKGDARQLTKVLANHNEEIGTIITSPPYANPRSSKGSLGEDDYDKDRNLQNPCGRGSYRGRYSTDPENIGNLPHGDIDAIITSPPYAETRIDVTNREEIQRKAKESFKKFGYFDFMGKRWTLKEWKKINKGRMNGRGVRHGNVKTYGKDPNNLSNLPYGEVDTIITSPPYAHQGSVYKGMLKKVERAFKEGKITKEQLEHFKGRKAYAEQAAEEYGQSKDQIGNLKYGKIDAIVTSPPYEGSVSSKGDPKRRAERMRAAGLDPKTIVGGTARCGELDWRYSADSNNLGNLKGETYLSAMLQVYRECYKVLKPDGLMILITKNFIRKKKIVRLDLDTIKLCRKAGFTFIDRWYRKLTNFSFWVINYYKKYGLRVEYEDILVFQKVKK